MCPSLPPAAALPRRRSRLLTALVGMGVLALLEPLCVLLRNLHLQVVLRPGHPRSDVSSSLKW
jgi:hypothetical protein